MRRVRRGAVAMLCVGSLVLGAPVGVAEDRDPAALVRPPAPSALAGQSIYFVMTDRYANGSTDNDTGFGRGGFNPTSTAYFHGGDFVGLRDHLDRIQRMGFTAIWITPPFVQQAVQGDTAGYHGYWGLDFLDVDPHLGTLAEFRALVDEIHRRGMRIYLDVVVNHTADVIRYRDGSSFVGPERQKDAYIPEGAPLKNPAWLNDLANYTKRGDANSCGWSGDDCLRNGDFYGLDDLKTSNPSVVQGWIDVYSWWVREFKIDGFRVDTAKHVDPAFLPVWSAAVTAAAREAGVPHFAMFGEFYEPSTLRLSEYLRDSRLSSALDFPAQSVIVDFASRSGRATDLRSLFQQDDLYLRGYSDEGTLWAADSLVTFGGNHDMGRIGLKVAAASFATGKVLTQRTQLAHSVLFLSRGVPAVYYGDEVGMMGSGGDRAARQDMFPTQVRTWRSEYRIGSDPIRTGSSLVPAAEEHPVARHIRALNALRDQYPALATGQMIMRYAKGSLAAWSKVDSSERREYVVAVNSGNSATSVLVPTGTPTTVFTPIFGRHTPVTSSAAGTLRITVPARTTLVLRPDVVMPSAAVVPSVTLSAATRDGLTGTRLLAATVGATRDAVSITFVGRSCVTCDWQPLATDGAAPFRYYLDDAWFADADTWEVVGVVRTSDGRTRISDPVTVRR